MATSSGTTSGRKRSIDSIIGRLSVREKQAEKLEIKAYTQWSPYLEKCCLLLSANESYERAAEDIQEPMIEMLTHIKTAVSALTFISFFRSCYIFLDSHILNFFTLQCGTCIGDSYNNYQL
jgi:hypothetical protein